MVFDSMATIVLLGTGLLGEAIGRRLLEQGVMLKVWNRTTEKCNPLVEQGAVLIESPPWRSQGLSWSDHCAARWTRERRGDC